MSTPTDSPARHFYLGCAVWAYRGFIGTLYPEGTRGDELLEAYVERLTAVEGNTTFYALPEASTLEKWAATMPEGFAFCPKLDRRITHEARLTEGKKLTLLFLERMALLGDNLGPVLVQLPPSYGPADYGDLKHFLSWWPHDRFEMALEVRHPGWWQEAPARGLTSLLSDYGVARVLLDTRPQYENPEFDIRVDDERKKPNVPVIPELTAPFTFVRFIAHPDADITLPYLTEWTEQVAHWLEQGTRVYFFSHCPIEERSPGYARQIQREVARLYPEVDPLPWDTAPTPPKQLGLF